MFLNCTVWLFRLERLREHRHRLVSLYSVGHAVSERTTNCTIGDIRHIILKRITSNICSPDRRGFRLRPRLVVSIVGDNVNTRTRSRRRAAAFRMTFFFFRFRFCFTPPESFYECFPIRVPHPCIIIILKTLYSLGRERHFESS